MNILRSIRPEKIVKPSDTRKDKNIFLTLGLIRNDLSDLLELHDLYIENTKRPEPEISLESGLYSGKLVYLDRLLLSHLHEILIFLNKENISSDLKFRALVKDLPKDKQITWAEILKMAAVVEKKNEIETSNLGISNKNILLLMLSTRNNTYHYWNVEVTLKKAFKYFFYQLEPKPKGSDKAYFVEEDHLYLKRSLYVDACLQYGLTDGGESIHSVAVRQSLIDLTKGVLGAINYFVDDYHQSLE